MTMMIIKTTTIIPPIAPPAIAPTLLPSLPPEYVRFYMYIILCSHQYSISLIVYCKTIRIHY